MNHDVAMNASMDGGQECIGNWQQYTVGRERS